MITANSPRAIREIQAVTGQPRYLNARPYLDQLDRRKHARYRMALLDGVWYDRPALKAWLDDRRSRGLPLVVPHSARALSDAAAAQAVTMPSFSLARA